MHGHKILNVFQEPEKTLSSCHHSVTNAVQGLYQWSEMYIKLNMK